MKTYQAPNGVYKATAKKTILLNLNLPFEQLRWDQQAERWLGEDLYEGDNWGGHWKPSGERYQNAEIVACGVETVKIDLSKFNIAKETN